MSGTVGVDQEILESRKSTLLEREARVTKVFAAPPQVAKQWAKLLPTDQWAKLLPTSQWAKLRPLASGRKCWPLSSGQKLFDCPLYAN